jgi:hypothetical protein
VIPTGVLADAFLMGLFAVPLVYGGVKLLQFAASAGGGL